MRRNAALLTMIVSDLGVAVATLFLYLRSRPAILAAFRAFDTALPPAAALALSPWFLPAALAFAAVSSLAGLVLPMARSRRASLVGAGLLVSSAALVFAVWAAFQPVFQPE